MVEKVQERDVITVAALNTKTVTNKAGKEFEAVDIVAANGQVYSTYPSVLPEGTLVGDTVAITSNRKTKQDGTTYNIVVDVKPAEAEKQTAKKSTAKKETWVSKPYDNSGARQGGAMHDAVAIAIRNSEARQSMVDMDEVSALYQSILNTFNG